MARKQQFRTVRISEEIAAKTDFFCKAIGWSFNQFCEYSVATVCGMIEDPAKREIPDVVLLVESVRRPREMLRNSEIGGTLKGSEDGHAKKKHA